MLLDDDELKKYLLKQNREMGRPGYDAGLGPPDMYGRRSPHKQEGWKDIIRQQLETNQFGPNLPRGLGLLESREQAQQVLGHELVDNMGPKIRPSFKDMMRTSPDGTRIPFPEQNPAGNPSWEQTDALYDQGQSNYYGPSGFQNEISPLPHQLEGPERGKERYGEIQYDPNQKLYDPYNYGTPGQMGTLPQDIIPSQEEMTWGNNPLNPESVTGTAMPGGKMSGLLDHGEGQFSQAFPGSDPNENWRQQGGTTQSTGEGGKWETEDSIFRRKKKKDGMENYMAKYLMQLGNQISSDEDTGWRSN
jgi:hypothetical protein